MVVSTSHMPPGTTARLANGMQPAVLQLFGKPVSVQIFNFTQAEFDWAKTSPNHVAGGVQRDGLTPDGEHMPPVKQNNPWPAVQQHLQVTQKSLYDALQSDGAGQEHIALSMSHHAIENVLKAYLSALGVRYDRTHVLSALVAQIPSGETAVIFPGEDWLLDLSNFRKIFLYLVKYPLPFPSAEAIPIAQDLCSRVASRALSLCQKTPGDVHYATRAIGTGNLERPLGGIEDADWILFQGGSQVEAAYAKGEARGRAMERRASLLDIARILCNTDQFVAFQQELDETDPQDWPDVQDVYWRFRPGQDEGSL